MLRVGWEGLGLQSEPMFRLIRARRLGGSPHGFQKLSCDSLGATPFRPGRGAALSHPGCSGRARSIRDPSAPCPGFQRDRREAIRIPPAERNLKESERCRHSKARSSGECFRSSNRSPTPSHRPAPRMKAEGKNRRSINRIRFDPYLLAKPPDTRTMWQFYHDGGQRRAMGLGFACLWYFS
jgi:hypothetical protein